MGEELERVTFRPIGLGERKKVAALGRAGIVDEDVEMAELALDRLDQRLGRGLLAQVEHADGGPAPLRSDRLGDLLERRHIAPGEHQVAAFGRECQGNAATDAAARSGHERDLALEAQFHPSPPASASDGDLIALAGQGMKGAGG
jgi:hypothetical protein